LIEDPNTNDEPEATEGEEAVPEETPAEEPAAEAPQADEPAAEETSADEPPAEETPAEEPPTEEPAAEQPADEAPADDEQAEPAPAADEEPAEQAEPPAAEQPGPPAADEGERPKAKDLPPGAELEPIALEPERELSAEERARLEAEAEERARLEADQEAGDEPVARSGPQVQLEAGSMIQATGKRKSSIARVVVKPGGGAFVVNSRPLDEYFPRKYLRTLARQPLVTTGYESTVDVAVRVHGGGIAGQAGAVRHGVARALTEIDSELRPELKRRGLLTRDARKKERRKAGLKKARKRPQFSKR
jgi:small subunit ribosomal protein S9